MSIFSRLPLVFCRLGRVEMTQKARQLLHQVLKWGFLNSWSWAVKRDLLCSQLPPHLRATGLIRSFVPRLSEVFGIIAAMLLFPLFVLPVLSCGRKHLLSLRSHSFLDQGEFITAACSRKNLPSRMCLLAPQPGFGKQTCNGQLQIVDELLAMQQKPPWVMSTC